MLDCSLKTGVRQRRTLLENNTDTTLPGKRIAKTVFLPLCQKHNKHACYVINFELVQHMLTVHQHMLCNEFARTMCKVIRKLFTVLTLCVMYLLYVTILC